jgi:hypothetical protein
VSTGADGGEDLPPRDHVGCLIVALRTGCGMILLQAIMAAAIIIAALFPAVLQMTACGP